MWRYLPPAVLMACSAVVLIAGATGDLESWSQSIAEMPSWRTMVDAHYWPALSNMWDSAVGPLKRTALPPADAAPPVPASTTAADAAGGAASMAAPSLPVAPEVKPVEQPAAVAQPPRAAVSATATAAAPQQGVAAAALLQRLKDARQALATGRATQAQKMMEAARAQMTFRATREGGGVQRDMPATWVGQALLSLKSGDSNGALHDLDLAIASS